MRLTGRSLLRGGARRYTLTATPTCGRGRIRTTTIPATRSGAFTAVLRPVPGYAVIYKIRDGDRTASLPVVVPAG